MAGPIRDAIMIPNKTARQERLDQILAEAIEKLKKPMIPNRERHVKIDVSFAGIHGSAKYDFGARRRAPTGEARPISGRSPCEVGVLPRTHGSAIIHPRRNAELGSGDAGDDRTMNNASMRWKGSTSRTFMLHYNFPPFSVGEARPLRSPGRREVGHGALAERALKSVIPTKDIFPYTLRIVSDILESNGSSSMATVCGGTLALMDAGVPIKEPVAGIAMGLIKEGDRRHGPLRHPWPGRSSGRYGFQGHGNEEAA